MFNFEQESEAAAKELFGFIDTEKISRFKFFTFWYGRRSRGSARFTSRSSWSRFVRFTSVEKFQIINCNNCIFGGFIMIGFKLQFVLGLIKLEF